MTDLFGNPPRLTQCENCGLVVLRDTATTVTTQMNNVVLGEEHFCSTQCAENSWQKYHGVQDDT